MRSSAGPSSLRGVEDQVHVQLLTLADEAKALLPRDGRLRDERQRRVLGQTLDPRALSLVILNNEFSMSSHGSGLAA